MRKKKKALKTLNKYFKNMHSTSSVALDRLLANRNCLADSVMHDVMGLTGAWLILTAANRAERVLTPVKPGTRAVHMEQQVSFSDVNNCECNNS